MNEIEIRNLTKSYGEQTVLKDVSVSFEKGKIHGLVGRNGSGKTVLFKCVCGLMQSNTIIANSLADFHHSNIKILFSDMIRIDQSQI